MSSKKTGYRGYVKTTTPKFGQDLIVEITTSFVIPRATQSDIEAIKAVLGEDFDGDYEYEYDYDYMREQTNADIEEQSTTVYRRDVPNKFKDLIDILKSENRPSCLSHIPNIDEIIEILKEKGE